MDVTWLPAVRSACSGPLPSSHHSRSDRCYTLLCSLPFCRHSTGTSPRLSSPPVITRRRQRLYQPALALSALPIARFAASSQLVPFLINPRIARLLSSVRLCALVVARAYGPLPCLPSLTSYTSSPRDCPPTTHVCSPYCPSAPPYASFAKVLRGPLLEWVASVARASPQTVV